MITKETKVRVFDNSGGKVGRIIYCYAKGILGSSVLIALRKIVPNNIKKLKKGDKIKGVVVGTSSFLKEPNQGFECKSLRNCVVLLKKTEEYLPMGTRVTRKVSKKVRYLGYLRVALISRGLF